LAGIFDEWNKGDLNSYLIEITSQIFSQNDPDNRQALRSM
jgi:6-phosphogluconate dehydrogenase